MMFLHLPWVVVSFLLAFFFMLFVREFFVIRGFHKGDPERGLAWFNVCVLFVALALIVVGGHILYRHERLLEDNFHIYPSARYAPEREILTPNRLGNTWIYVTLEPREAIAEYYQTFAKANDYTFIRDESASSTRLLFTKQDQKLFLTIKREEEVSVLYYSRDGDITAVTSPVSH